MKNTIKCSLAAAAIVAAVSSCTEKFGEYNTDPDSLQEVPVKMYVTTMLADAMIPTSGKDDDAVNAYQRGYNLAGDGYCGYLAPTQSWGNYTLTYYLDMDFNNAAFSTAYTKVMPAWLQLKYAHENEVISDNIFAIAEVVRVFTLQRISDIYGPIPVSGFGTDNNPYESQETVYTNLMKDLNAAITVLEEYAANAAGDNPLQKEDLIYGGNAPKWLKFANTLKLRMAVRMRYVEPGLAKTYAEEAVASGVMTDAADGAYLSDGGDVIKHPLQKNWDKFSDTRMGATMDAYLNGYEDPRLAKYFKEAAKTGGYHGIRTGISSMPSKDDYLDYASIPAIEDNTPIAFMRASEAAFLMAEGALAGWNMGGESVEDLYKNGITLSFDEHELTGAEEYAASDKTPATYKDETNASTKHDAGQPSTVTPAWDNGASDEVKLEKIITQKWIAIYPDGQEAWSEFRRTGYPKVIPIVDNRSGGIIDTDIQVRRMTFPRSEYTNNGPAVTAAAALLDGGRDTGASRLWWDKK